MNRDSTLLEEAYLSIVEMYYGYDDDDREDPHHSYQKDLSFFIKRDILNKSYIVHFYCTEANVSGNPNSNKKKLDYEYKNAEFLVWDVSKTPEILKLYRQAEEEGTDFVSNLTDEVIDKAIINYPSKNPDFVERYRRTPFYGVLIRDTFEMADDSLYEGFINTSYQE